MKVGRPICSENGVGFSDTWFMIISDYIILKNYLKKGKRTG